MATVTGLTAERMLEIEENSIVDGDVVAGNLILTKQGGAQINAGNVVGPEGPEGPVGSDLAVVASKPILDIGLVNQIRAGRQLGPEDFGNIGMSAPLGLWNLSGLTDVSGNGRNLLNKGAVPFGMGINGIASTAAIFVGSTAQALYIVDTGAADPFRIKTGSFGAWFRTAKRATAQDIMSKFDATSGQYGYLVLVDSLNRVVSHISSTGSDLPSVIGFTDVCDDRWHFVVVTHDASTHKVYVDGALEAVSFNAFPIFGSSAPLNIGGRDADASTVATSPFNGRVDEAFVTSDVLTEDQIRNLYCAKIPHTLAAIPSRVILNVRRQRKGPALVTADFPAQPLRLHNFSAASLGDAGTHNVSLANTGPAVGVGGVDGTPNNAFNFAGSQYLASSDASLPSFLNPVSYGCWIKTVNLGATIYIMTYGAVNGTNDNRLYLAAGVLSCSNAADGITGPFVADGNWHFVVVVQDNTAADGVKRKLYVDGRLVGTSLVMSSVTLGGANKFVVGANLALAQTFVGQIDSVFVSNTAFTLEDILKLYTKGSQALAPSPKNAGDHIEAMDADNLLAIFDTLDGVAQVDMKVAS